MGAALTYPVERRDQVGRAQGVEVFGLVAGPHDNKHVLLVGGYGVPSGRPTSGAVTGGCRWFGHEHRITSGRVSMASNLRGNATMRALVGEPIVAALPDITDALI
jgi:hypothetical protein